MKLSKAQETVLKRMHGGKVLCWMDGLHAYAWWAGSGERSPNSAGLFRLVDFGLLTLDGEFNSKVFTLTPKGKEVAEGLE